MRHVKLLVAVVAVCGFFLWMSSAAAQRGDTNARRATKNAATASERSPYTIYDGDGSLIRSGETQWQIQLDELDDPIVLSPVGGRSNIPLNADLQGRINLGMQGSKMVLLIETDGTDGSALYQAVLMFDRAGVAALSGVIPNHADADFSRMNESDRAMAVASLMMLAERLRIVSAMSSGLAVFGDDTIVTKLALSSKACAVSCGCFLSCDACCSAGQVATCDCRFLGHSSCECNNGNNVH